MQPLSTGDVIDWPSSVGRYEIVGRLATGGMAEILLGRLHGPGGFERPVVVKRILPHLARQDAFVRMLTDEARIAAQIRSDNVVQVHELGQEGGELFIVQEYLEGESAFGLIRAVVRAKRKLPPWLAASIVADACAGLQAAHELADANGESLGVVHRDVSPENVFVTYRGGVKILDFGVALARDRLADTQTGSIKGKFGYMSPEQCRGDVLDQRSDIFSLGVVLHELVSGARLFKRPNALAAVQAICEEPIVSLLDARPDCPPALARICARALDRDRDRRQGTAAELRAELQRVMRESNEDPTAARSALMTELFAGRIVEKREMLHRLATSRTLVPLPATEIDLDVEVPAVAPARRPRLPGPIIASAALLVLLAGLAGYVVSSREVPQKAEVAPRIVAPVPPVVPTIAPPVVPPVVHLAITSAPPGAHVLVDDKERGLTPISLELDRSTTPAHVRLQHAGYVGATREFVPSADGALRLELARVRRPAPAHAPPQFHRF